MRLKAYGLAGCEKLCSGEAVCWDRMWLASHHARGEDQDQNSHDDAVNSKRGETTLADPCHEPGHAGVSNDERDDESDREHNPLIGSDLRDADGIFPFP